MIRRMFDRWRKPPQCPPQPEAERDWEVGDVAECIAGNGNWITWPFGRASGGPERGRLVRVGDLFADETGLWLVFREYAGQAFPAGHFRKLRPGALELALDRRREAREPELVE